MPQHAEPSLPSILAPGSKPFEARAIEARATEARATGARPSEVRPTATPAMDGGGQVEARAAIEPVNHPSPGRDHGGRPIGGPDSFDAGRGPAPQSGWTDPLPSPAASRTVAFVEPGGDLGAGVRDPVLGARPSPPAAGLLGSIPATASDVTLPAAPPAYVDADSRNSCTAAQLRRFIKSRAYVPLHELRRRFELDGDEDDVSPMDLDGRRLFVGLPAREAALLGELLRAGDVGYELLLDPTSPLVVGVFPMRPVPRA